MYNLQLLHLFPYKVLLERMDQLEEMLNKKEKFLQVCNIVYQVILYVASHMHNSSSKVCTYVRIHIPWFKIFSSMI